MFHNILDCSSSHSCGVGSTLKFYKSGRLICTGTVKGKLAYLDGDPRSHTAYIAASESLYSSGIVTLGIWELMLSNSYSCNTWWMGWTSHLTIHLPKSVEHTFTINNTVIHFTRKSPSGPHTHNSWTDVHGPLKVPHEDSDTGLHSLMTNLVLWTCTWWRDEDQGSGIGCFQAVQSTSGELD